MTTIDVAVPAIGRGRAQVARRVLLVSIGVGLATAVALLLVAITRDNGHALTHAVTGFVLLLLAGAIAWRSRAAGVAAQALAVGLAAVALPVLIEGLGALGYDDVTGERTGALSALHDVGLATSALGLLALVVGIAISTAIVITHRTGRSARVAAAMAIAIAAVGMLGIKVLVVGM